MAKKTISITEQVEALQKENNRLSELNKLLEKAVKWEFGYSINEIHHIISEYNKPKPEKLPHPRTTQGQ